MKPITRRGHSRTSFKRSQAWSVAPLEPRQMLAADVGVALSSAMGSADTGQAADVASNVSQPAVPTEHLVIIDVALADQASWGDSIPSNAEMILLNDQQDAVQQISQILKHRTGIESLHIISHGSEGQLRLAGENFDTQTLLRRHHEISAWKSSFAANADLLLYGCDVAAGEQGIRLTTALANLLDVDVAASSDRTGSASRHANWALEHTIGAIEYSGLLDQRSLNTFQGYLGVQIWAAGTTTNEIMELQIGDQVVSSWTVSDTDAIAEDYRSFYYDQEGVSLDQIRINFINDLYDPDNGIDRNLRIDRIVVDGVTYQTEDPSVYSTGTWLPGEGAQPGNHQSEYLHTDGFLQFSSDNPGSVGSRIDIFAQGDTGTETMQLLIDGNVVQTFLNVSSAGDVYSYDAGESVTADRVQIAFTDDAYQPELGFDKNLRVDRIVIDGETFQTEAASTYSTGTYVDGQGVIPGYRQSEYLHADGYFQFLSDNPGGQSSHIDIYAQGDTGDETMQLLIDGNVVQTYLSIATGGDVYSYDTDEAVTADRIRIAFAGDVYRPDVNYDQNLRIDRIVIDGQTFQTEAASTYSTGTYLDGQGIVPRNSQSEYLHADGYFQFLAGPPSGDLPAFAIASSNIVVSESAGNAIIEITRSGDLSRVSTVDYQVFDQTATSGLDYVATSGTLTFAAFESVKSVAVTIIDDNDRETTERFSFTIDNSMGADLSAPRTATITIFDDDTELPAYSDFSAASGIDLNGSAALVGGKLELTSELTYQTGSAFFQSPILVDNETSFQVEFAFEMVGGYGTGGADGIVFLLQNSPAGTSAIGGGGGGIGYAGIGNSLAIELDTWLNAGDLYKDEVAVVINGNVGNATIQRPAPFNLNYGGVYHTWIDYNGFSNTLSVYLSESSEKPELATLKTQIALNEIVGGQMYAGFTSSDFDRPNAHRILSWSMNLESPPSDPPVNPSGQITGIPVITGLNQPTSIAWSVDGRNLYIGEKSGIVKVARDGQLQGESVIDISARVNNVADRGLLDIAIHPDLNNHPYLYLLYAHDPIEVYDHVGNPNAGPDQSGNRAGQLMRVTLDSATDFTSIIAGSETIILGTNSTWENFNAFTNSVFDFAEPPAGVNADGTYLNDFINSDSTTHSVGSLAFANDGSLLVSIGDGASYNRVDPRASRVQDIDSLSGKILRIDPITGQGLSDNPFYNNDPNANRSKVYQLGLRNPFRISVDDVTGRLFIGDVGWTRWEEVNTGGPGANFGWPYYEGGAGESLRTGGGYELLPDALAFYASGQPVVSSLTALNHAADGINAIVLGDVIRGGNLGTQYEGDVLFNDLGQGIVRNLSLNANGDVTEVQVFATGAQYVVAIRQGPDGSVYYVDLDDGLIGRWELA